MIIAMCPAHQGFVFTHAAEILDHICLYHVEFIQRLGNLEAPNHIWFCYYCSGGNSFNDRTMWDHLWESHHFLFDCFMVYNV
ncbi:hypothetical protein N7466_011264 [Penicillium verhagenii]|uniref:uncharacterized protein n=1 Tax=Penicillium verhagenii TaxID=1562060 RepID=UPI002545078B|nr:uncharacterized protein N7466_011669 [Penicillium verhagenii]XP_057016385.1 uncharacterized protein N7466_011264 [Penicillium verhagenii]KAJ5915736.1 hypothetical protein N7466_011669 [Penicillium verhagenii]KAJ5917710.1 hypothetical protein N7466_011264 [Penicillium verhagenii]